MLSATEIQTIIEEFKPYSPKKISVFGSYARGENSADSDLDLLYNFENGITLFQLAKLKLQLENKLHREIDLVSENYISRYLRDNILNDIKILYEA